MESNSLFVYGTLMVPEIVERLIHRVPRSVPATLPGYSRRLVKSAPYPGVVADPQDSVDGILYFEVSGDELQVLDRYEGDLYQATNVTVSMKVDHSSDEDETKFAALVYKLRPGFENRLSEEKWDLSTFRRRDLPVYLNRF